MIRPRSVNQAVFFDKQSMKVLAENTGGRAFTDSWDGRNAARTLVTDNNDHYVLGIRPEPYKPDEVPRAGYPRVHSGRPRPFAAGIHRRAAALSHKRREVSAPPGAWVQAPSRSVSVEYASMSVVSVVCTALCAV